MNRFFLFSLTFFYFFVFSQKKVTIIDSQKKEPIFQARIIYYNQVYYTNEEGIALVPNEAAILNLYAPQYGSGEYDFKDTIALRPVYNEIEEVVIRQIDAKKIIGSVLKNYNKNYETNTSVYNGTIKSKSEIDNKLNRLLIIDMDLWTLNNKYNYRKSINEFMQVNLRNKKFDKNKIDDKSYIFNKKSGEREQKYIKSFLQRFFLYNQLYIMDYYTKGLKINGNIINEKDNIQTIKFKSDKMSDDILYYEGIMQYNKIENTIIYLKCSQIQKNTFEKYTNYFDQEIVVNTNLFSVTYDMYKKNEKYIPAKIITESIAYYNLNNKQYQGSGYTEFIFQNQNYADKNGFSKKIDLSKPFSENILDNTVKDTKTLLSTEEQKFVDEP